MENKTDKFIKLPSRDFWDKKAELFCEIAKENGYDNFTKEFVMLLPCSVISLVVTTSGKEFPYTAI